MGIYFERFPVGNQGESPLLNAEESGAAIEMKIGERRSELHRPGERRKSISRLTGLQILNPQKVPRVGICRIGPKDFIHERTGFFHVAMDMELHGSLEQWFNVSLKEHAGGVIGRKAPALDKLPVQIRENISWSAWSTLNELSICRTW
jgi:hypothetical protein